MKLGVTILISIGLWWVATEKAGLQQTLRLRVVDYQVDLSFLAGIPYLIVIYIVVAGTTSAVNLTDGLDGLAAGCAAIVLLSLHRHHVHHDRPARPRAAVGLPGRGLRRVPLVQRVPGDDLHGGHGIARVGRRDRGRSRS